MKEIKKLIAERAQIKEQIEILQDDLEDLQADLENVNFYLKENISDLLVEHNYNIKELINELKELDI